MAKISNCFFWYQFLWISLTVLEAWTKEYLVKLLIALPIQQSESDGREISTSKHYIQGTTNGSRCNSFVES